MAQHNEAFVNIELSIDEVRGVHTGGMKMDDSSPSQDIYADPYIILRDGTTRSVSRNSALRVERALHSRLDDDFGTPGG